MYKSILKLCRSVLIVVVLVAIVDIAVGYVMDWILPRTGNKGDLCLTNLGVNVIETPIVIVGSSRASHHYDPRIFADSLGRATYNVGTDGCFFTHNCCVINSILERYSPELIIWEFEPSYLFEHSADDITSMYLYYNKRDYITKTLNEVLPRSEVVKLNSNIYRYNSKFIRVLTRYLQNNDTPDEYSGYEPSAPKSLKEPLSLVEEKSSSTSVIDSSKLYRFKETVENAKTKGCKIALVNSPRYAIDSNVYMTDTVTDLCHEQGVSFIDCSQLYINHPEYFNDPSHLNAIGADFYTKHIISLIGSMSNL